MSLSERYPYSEGWRTVSKHAFGTVMFNQRTDTVVWINRKDTRIHWILKSRA